GHHRPGQARPTLHTLVVAQTRRPPGLQTRTRAAHRPREPAHSAPPPPHHLSTHHDVERLTRPRTRYQTRPHRTRHGALSRPDLCLRRVRPLGHPPHCRHEHPVSVRGAEPRGQCPHGASGSHGQKRA